MNPASGAPGIPARPRCPAAPLWLRSGLARVSPCFTPPLLSPGSHRRPLSGGSRRPPRAGLRQRLPPRPARRPPPTCAGREPAGALPGIGGRRQMPASGANSECPARLGGKDGGGGCRVRSGRRRGKHRGGGIRVSCHCRVRTGRPFRKGGEGSAVPPAPLSLLPPSEAAGWAAESRRALPGRGDWMPRGLDAAGPWRRSGGWWGCRLRSGGGGGGVSLSLGERHRWGLRTHPLRRAAWARSGSATAGAGVGRWSRLLPSRPGAAPRCPADRGH